MRFGFPKYRWGMLVHSVSQVFASICLKGTTCVTCQLLRKGTNGADICILFFDENDKTPREITAPSVIY